MKKFLIILRRYTGTLRTLEADVEFHETDCPNLARTLKRQNSHEGRILATADMFVTIEDLRQSSHNIGQTTKHIIHDKKAGRYST